MGEPAGDLELDGAEPGDRIGAQRGLDTDHVVATPQRDREQRDAGGSAEDRRELRPLRPRGHQLHDVARFAGAEALPSTCRGMRTTLRASVSSGGAPCAATTA